MPYKFNTNDFLVRIPLFIIFFWFGLLKVLKMSPATELIIDTVFWMPILTPEDWVIVIGYWGIGNPRESFISKGGGFYETVIIGMIIIQLFSYK